MRIVIIGLGSMGRRRLRILQKLDKSFQLFGVDSRPDRREQISQEFGIPTYVSLEKVMVEVDVIFVCTAPQSHVNVFQGIDLGKVHTFSELDLLTAGYDRLLAAEASQTKRHFISSTPLYDDDGCLVAALTRPHSRLTYHYHVGQYLPDWHPWESYKDLFAVRRETNGCREILGIELPWLETCFGPILETSTVSRRLSDLEIDFPDTVLVNLTHASGVVGSFLVDIVSPQPVHDLEVIGEQFYLTWNGTPNSVRRWDRASKGLVSVGRTELVVKESGYAEFISENPYEAEVTEFFAGLENPEQRFRFSYRDSKRILEIIDRIEGLA